MCDTNKNVTKMGMIIIKGVYCIILWGTLITKNKNLSKRYQLKCGAIGNLMKTQWNFMKHIENMNFQKIPFKFHFFIYNNIKGGQDVGRYVCLLNT
jgi:hypothetical protein